VETDAAPKKERSCIFRFWVDQELNFDTRKGNFKFERFKKAKSDNEFGMGNKSENL